MRIKWILLLASTLLLSGLPVGTEQRAQAAACGSASNEVTVLSDLPSKVSSAARGSTIIVCNNTYSNAGTITLSNTTAATSASDTITIRAETQGGVELTGKLTFKLSGSSYLKLDGFYFNKVLHEGTDSLRQVVVFSNCDYCTLSNNYFYSSGNKDTTVGSDPALTNGASTHIVRFESGTEFSVIENNTFENSISQSVGIVNGTSPNLNTNNTVRWNYFVNIPSTQTVWGSATTNGMEPIQIGQSGSTSNFNIAEFNLMQNVIGDASEMISVKSSQNTVRFNTFRDSDSRVTIRLGTGSLIEGNFFFNSNGVRAYGDNHIIKNNYIQNPQFSGINLADGNATSHPSSTGTVVMNNTIVDQSGPYNSLYIGNNASNIKVYNNLVRKSTTGEAYTQSATGTSSIDFQKNLSDVTGSATAKSANITSGITTAATNLVASGELFRTPSSGIVLSHGGVELTGVIEKTGTYSTDMDGQSRGTTIDIGADEYSSGSIVRKPLTVYDVGPTGNWWLNKRSDGRYAIDGGKDSYLEAEWFMNKSGAFDLVNDSSRSGGAYMSIPETAGDHVSSIWTEYGLDVTNGGSFDVWMLASAADNGSDSFQLSVDNGTAVDAVITYNSGFVWRKAYTGLSLSTGQHSLKVIDREDGAMVDKIMLTKNTSHAVPAGNGDTALYPKHPQIVAPGF